MVHLVHLQIDALAHAHALSFVNKQRVGLDRNVILKVKLASHECFEAVSRLRETCLQLRDARFDDGNLLDEAVLNGVTTKLDVRSETGCTLCK